MRSIRTLVVGALLVLLFLAALLYGADNSTPVALVFLNWTSFVWPVAWWVLSAFLVGGLCGTLLGAALNLPLRVKLRNARKALEENRAELDRLRTLNLK